MRKRPQNFGASFFNLSIRPASHSSYHLQVKWKTIDEGIVDDKDGSSFGWTADLMLGPALGSTSVTQTRQVPDYSSRPPQLPGKAKTSGPAVARRGQQHSLLLLPQALNLYLYSFFTQLNISERIQAKLPAAMAIPMHRLGDRGTL
jgi:hypothetical protein